MNPAYSNLALSVNVRSIRMSIPGRTFDRTIKHRPKGWLILLCAALISIVSDDVAGPPPTAGKTRPVFDGKTLAGWEGNSKLWRVEDGCLTGGSLAQTVTQNEFLASRGDFTNFIVRFQIKLTGKEGFINS